MVVRMSTPEESPFRKLLALTVEAVSLSAIADRMSDILMIPSGITFEGCSLSWPPLSNLVEGAGDGYILPVKTKGKDELPRQTFLMFPC